MESFDHSLKYLLQHAPAGFLQFGLADPTVEVLGALPSNLPSRGRDVDGGYLISLDGARIAAHIEFHRRHQGLDDLAIDVAEAQIRLHRRERLPVLSQVWDLYGSADDPFTELRTLRYGTAPQGPGSQAIYQRINLRSLGWRQFLAQAPPALWPLVALTSDGAREEAVQSACDAIEARTDLTPTERADHLAVLWFVAEAEDVPTRLMRVYISEGRLMESGLYKSIFEKGEAQGRAETERQLHADAIIRVLMARLGTVAPHMQEQIRSMPDRETLARWYDAAFLVVDAKGAEQLLDNIRKTLAT